MVLETLSKYIARNVGITMVSPLIHRPAANALFKKVASHSEERERWR